MLPVYLPIAEISIDITVLLALGAVIGFLTGAFGVGGGFLMTPMLIFLGIPPGVAVASGATQILASSVSGVMEHWRRGNVDMTMGGVLLAGGLAGSSGGVFLFRLLTDLGLVDLIVRLSYVVLLGSIGVMMLVESLRTLRKASKPTATRGRLHKHNLFHHLPLRMRFRKSNLYISIFVPLTIGAFVGLLTAVLGVGGGFIMVPAMIYLIGMSTLMVVGTSLFQIAFVTANTALFQAWINQTVDLTLVAALIVGGLLGTQLGARFSIRLRGEYMRLILSLLVIGVGGSLLVTLLWTPSELFEIEILIPATEGS